jgi:hypothetical protein
MKRDEFYHHQTGRSIRYPELLALRWRDWEDLTRDQIQEAIEGHVSRHGLRVFQDEAYLRTRQIDRINNSSVLTWVVRKDGGEVEEDDLARLEDNTDIQWLSGAFASVDARDPIDALFCIDPSRLYVASSVSFAQDPESVGIEAEVDEKRSKFFDDMVVWKLRRFSIRGTDAVDAERELASRLNVPPDEPSPQVRFETYPLVNPSGSTPRRLPGSNVPIRDRLFKTQWGLHRIGAPEAWQLVAEQPTSPVVLAVIDTGVDGQHPDLAIDPNSMNVTTGLPVVADGDGHGTRVAGIAGARHNNIGVAGVSGDVRILSLAVPGWSDRTVEAAINLARNLGARVINMSFVEKEPKWDRDKISAALRSASEHDIVLVAAAGNENVSFCGYPGNDPTTICVGGSTQDDRRKTPGGFSTWGSNFGDDLDVMAPSELIPTTDLRPPEGSEFRNFSQTSAATPHVSGVAALILSVRPNLASGHVRALIERNCDKVNAASHPYAQTRGRPNGTWNREMGYGRLSASAAIGAALRNL